MHGVLAFGGESEDKQGIWQEETSLKKALDEARSSQLAKNSRSLHGVFALYLGFDCHSFIQRIQTVVSLDWVTPTYYNPYGTHFLGKHPCKHVRVKASSCMVQSVAFGCRSLGWKREIEVLGSYWVHADVPVAADGQGHSRVYPFWRGVGMRGSLGLRTRWICQRSSLDRRRERRASLQLPK